MNYKNSPKGVRSYTTIIASIISLLSVSTIEADFSHFKAVEASVVEVCNSNNPPIALQSAALSDISALLEWRSTNTPPEEEWDLEIIPASASFTGNPTHLGVLSNPFTVSGLLPGTEYKFKVRAVCQGFAGSWSNGTSTFLTAFNNGSICGADVTIPDVNCDTPLSIPIQVNTILGDSLGRNIVLQQLKLTIDHDWLIDIHMDLVSPFGDTVALVSENGDTGHPYGNPNDLTCSSNAVFFNSSNCSIQSIKDASPPYSGNYLPIGHFNFFNNLSSPNGTWQLLICDDAPGNVGKFKNAELIFAPTNCEAPQGLQASNVLSESILLDWGPGGYCQNTILEIGTPGFTPGTGDTILATCPPYQLTGLTGGSEYEIHISEQCGLSSFSQTSCEPLYVKTPCTPPTISIEDNFDNLQSCPGFFCTLPCDITGSFWQNSRDERMEWTVYQNVTASSGTGPSADVSGNGKYLYMETSSHFFFGECEVGAEAELRSKSAMVDTKSSDTCHVQFSYHMYGQNVNSLSFEVTTNGRDWTTIWSESGNQGNEWHQVKLSLLPYNGQKVQFRFLGTKGIDHLGDIGLDEITFFGTEALPDPMFVFYVDSDGDGYGDPEKFTENSFDYAPPGYVSQGGDCDDTDSNIYPGAPEIPCNFVDENCNGVADDLQLLPPGVVDSLNFCEGDIVTLSATPNVGGTISWFDESYNYFGDGNSLVVNDLSPGVYTFLAEESLVFCFSTEPARVKVVIHSKPEISTSDAPIICKKEEFDLRNIQVFDQNNTSGTLTYHSQSSADDSNELVSPIVTPDETTTYFIKKNSTGNCFDLAPITITVLASPAAEINPDIDEKSLCKGDAIFLSGSGTGGMGNLDFQWSNLQSAPTIRVGSGAVTGDEELVTFTVTDDNNCTSIDSILIKTVSSVDTVEIVKTEASVCNGNDGSITITPIDGVPNFNYNWTGPVSGNVTSGGRYTLPGLQQGSYSVTITDDSPDGCPLVLSNLVIDGPSAKVTLNSIEPVGCFGDSTGAISLTVTGNNPTINWSPITAFAEKVENLPAGTYNVTVSDGDCESVLTDIIISEPDSLYALTQANDLTCFENSDGSIDVEVFGGTAPFDFDWNNAPSVQNPDGLSVGTYQVSITDFNGCEFTSNSMTIDQPNEMFVLVENLTNPECFGFETGKIDLNVSGGTPPYQFEWNDNGLGKNRSNLAAGQYSVTVNDSKGCFKILPAIIIENPDSIIVEIDTIIEPDCIGSLDGSILTTISGGTGQLNFEWNGITGTDDLIDVESGIYLIEITDINNCVLSQKIELPAPSLLTIEPDFFHPICEGQNSGAINLDSIEGGTAPFQFNWSNNTQSRNLIGIGNGFYAVTITDAKNCVSEFDSLEIVGEQKLNADNLQALSPVCHDEKTGKIFSNILGGLSPMTFEWSDPTLSGQNLENLESGNYLLTVTDGRGCRLETDTIKIVNPDSLYTLDAGIEEILCHGESSGSITVQASGGVAPYDFVWNGGQMYGSTISNLPAGDYRLIVTDSLNCSVTHPVKTLGEPEDLIADYLIANSDNGCDSANLFDTVQIVVAGGVLPINYSWSNATSDSMLTNIKPGEYSVTVTDENGCSEEIKDIKVPINPLNFQFASFFKKDITCNGDKDGAIEMTFVGGTQPYQYLWSDGFGDLPGGTIPGNTIVFSDLDTGVYKVTVLDADGCPIFSDPISIEQPIGFNQTLLSSDSVSCFGGSDGQLEIEVAGGNFPYTYEWRRNADTATIARTKNLPNRPVGIYRCDITDSKGCKTFLERLEISQPDTFKLQLVDIQGIRCLDEEKGRIEVAASGGTPSYNFFWETGMGTGVRDDLPPGNYSLTVSDANRCILSESFEITAPDSAFVFEGFSQENIDCYEADNGTLQLDFSGGTRPYIFVLDNNNQPSFDGYFEGIAPGTHAVLIEDSNNCRFDTLFVFEEPDEILISEDIIHVTNPFIASGEIQITASGGTPPLQFLWNDGDTSQNRKELAPGLYLLLVTDGNGCQKEGAFRVKISSGAGQLNLNGEITLAPNPTEGKLKIRFDLVGQNSFTGKLFSGNGKILQEFIFDNVSKTDREIDLTQEPDGIYYVSLQNETGWKTWRIVKMRK